MEGKMSAKNSRNTTGVDSPNRARRYLQSHTPRDANWHTVNFLLNIAGAIGIRLRIPIDQVLQHLLQQNINLSREQFQQTTLGDLKREGIVATLPRPGKRGGLFIPETQEDVETATIQVLQRMESEARNLRGLTDQMQWGRLIELLQSIISWIGIHISN
jgi:hypothetical protein